MTLLNLIDHLPSASNFGEEQANDEELIASYLRQHPDEETIRPPRVSEWTPDRAELTNIVDMLANLIAVQVAANGGKPGAVKPRPRPQTAVDRVRHRVREEQHQSLVQRLIRKR